MHRPLCILVSSVALRLRFRTCLSGRGEEPAGRPVVRDPQGQGPVRPGLRQVGRLEVRGRLRFPRRPGRPHAASTRACCSAAPAPKIRIGQNVELEPGRYKITAYLRGLDIGTGIWNATTEFMFDGKYFQLEEERHVRLDQAHLRRRDQGEEEGRPVVRPDGAGLLLDRRRLAGEGGRRRAADRRSRCSDKEEAPIAPPGELGAGPSAARSAATATCPPGRPATPAARRWRRRRRPPPGRRSS